MNDSVADTHDEGASQASRYTSFAIALHWILAIGLIYQLGLGVWMEDIPKTPPGIRAEWFNWHKSIGLVLGLLIVLRSLWRLTHRPPTLPEHMPRWQAVVAHVNHALLYACWACL
jgi:cytochrome b561